MKQRLPDPMLPRLYRIQHVHQEIPRTFTLELVPEDGDVIPPFHLGQFNMLSVFGMGEIPLSISGDPARPHLLVHTIRAVGSVSRALQRLKKGEVLGVRGPFGSHWPLEQATGKDLIIAAGGLGLAPLRSVMYQVLAQRARYGKVIVLYGTRTPADILYRRELEHWRGRLDLEVSVTVDRAPDDWRGSVGVVTRLIARASFDPTRTVAFVCGPEIMMRFTASSLIACGVAEDQMYLSLERNMKCALGFCGHCQYREYFVCRDGPIFPYRGIRELLREEEI
jgi:NAD(P)H-flavin reductase